jgi:hypothetical protein
MYPVDLYNRGPSPCPGCGKVSRIELFPAFFRPVRVTQPGELAMVDGEASCFYHPQKKAAVPCAACGRFLCSLCDCELHGQHYCPGCLETGRKKGKIKNLENERTLYGGVALSLALLPLLIFYFTIFTAPMALYVAIRHWKSPRSLVRPGNTAFVLAILFATLELVGWAVALYAIATA